jgi:ubiquinone/menaquinone biosynthesis C-methylase UbiE
MSATRVRHPIFARLYARTSPGIDRKGAAGHRDEMLAGLAGRVIEVGAGNGMNFGHYPGTVTEVVAVEPEPYLREKAGSAAQSAPVTVSVVDGVADALPAEDGAFEAAVASLVLCSVPDQAAALAEIRRVLRPGGELRFYEHVVAGGRLGTVQRRLDDWGVWPRLSGGCHGARDTATAIATAGFAIERCRTFPFAAGLPVTVPHIVGTARRD